MPTFRTARVVEVLAARPGLQRVALDDGSRAYALTELVGSVAVGDELVVNTTAVDLGLGTGGWHVVHWNLARRELHAPSAGHIMKLRYTSLQLDVATADGDLRERAHLGGVPVLAATLHSQVGVLAAVLKSRRPDVRVSYVMTDGGALPLALSDLVATLCDTGLLDGTITAGHAFGGDLEAVSVPAALCTAVDVQRADVIVCAMGPGVVGTGSTLGTTAVEASAVLTWTTQLGGRPVLVARASSADARDRHRGLSHHTRTVLALTPTPVDVPLPEGSDLADGVPAPHRVVPVAPVDVAGDLVRHGLDVTTMGRGPDRDPLFFHVTAVAAAHVADTVGSP